MVYQHQHRQDNRLLPPSAPLLPLLPGTTLNPSITTPMTQIGLMIVPLPVIAATATVTATATVMIATMDEVVTIVLDETTAMTTSIATHVAATATINFPPDPKTPTVVSVVAMAATHSAHLKAISLFAPTSLPV